MQATNGARLVEALTLQQSNTQPYRAMGSDLALREQVESLYQRAVSSDQEFCIDLEGEAPDGHPVWEWMGYSTKGNATRSLAKLIDGVDFLLISGDKQTIGRGGHNRETAVFSRDGFKQWGMLAGTDRGRQIRLYFIECEKRLQLGMAQPTALNGTLDRLAETVRIGLAGLYTSNAEIKQELGDLGQRVARLEEQQCDQLYVFVRSSDLTLMLGYSSDLDTRRKAHERRGFKLVGAVSGTQKQESRIKASLKHRGFKPKNGTEEYQLCPELVEAFAQEGLPVGELCCTKPALGLKRRGGPDSLTPPLF